MIGRNNYCIILEISVKKFGNTLNFSFYNKKVYSQYKVSTSAPTLSEKYKDENIDKVRIINILFGSERGRLLLTDSNTHLQTSGGLCNRLKLCYIT